MRARSLVVFSFLGSFLGWSPALAEGPPPPPGWGKPAALPPANGEGRVTFKHGGRALALPLNRVEIDTKVKDMFMVSLAYVDTAQENKLDLAFASMPKLGGSDPRTITGFLVKTSAQGLSRHAANRTRCDFAISRLTAEEVSGTLSCKGMADLSAEKSAPDVTDVRFDAKLKPKR